MMVCQRFFYKSGSIQLLKIKAKIRHNSPLSRGMGYDILAGARHEHLSFLYHRTQ